MRRLELFWGAEHSPKNAAAIRAWLAAGKYPPSTVRVFVEDWRRRDYLTNADAEALLA